MAVIADSTSFKTPYPRSLARRLRLAGFGDWWKRELAAAMPARLRNALERRRARPVLAFDGSRATLWRPSPANGEMKMVAVADVPLYADAQSVEAAGRAAFAPLVATSGASPKIIISLSPRASLRKMLTLPMALEDHLHQALAYDLDRHTPFKPEELYFDAVVVDRDSVHNTLRVDLAAARRSLVDTLLRQAEGFGARVVGVTVEPPATASTSRLNLLPEDRRMAAPGFARWQVILPAVLLALGVLAALVLPIWQAREEAIALSDVTDQARERATVSDRLRTELERRINDYNFALDRKYAFPGIVQVLDDVTRILPDDTWLTQLEIHTVRGGKDIQREVTLRGESANAGRLVSLLEDSKLFTQAAPRSPTTKIQPGPGEIFDVSAHLKPLPAPTPLPIDMTAPAPPPRRPAAAGAARPAPGPATAAPAAKGAQGTASPGTTAPAGSTPTSMPAPPSAPAATPAPGTVRGAPPPHASTPAPATLPGAMPPPQAVPQPPEPEAPAMPEGQEGG